jgi:hypothetical protein
MSVPPERLQETFQGIFQQVFQEKMQAFLKAAQEPYPAVAVDLQVAEAALSTVENLAKQLNIQLSWPAKQEAEAPTPVPSTEPPSTG